MTQPHPQSEYPHSNVFGSNLNYQLEQILQANDQKVAINPQTLQPQPQPHANHPVSHQQDKYNRRIDMY